MSCNRKFEAELLVRIGPEEYAGRLERMRCKIRSVEIPPHSAKKLLKRIRDAEFVVIEARLAAARKKVVSNSPRRGLA